MSWDVALVGWLWLGSPFVVIALISHDRRLLRQITIHHSGCLTAGWSGVVMMCLGVALMPSPLGTLMFWVGTPMAGLAVWLRRNDGGGGGGGGGPDVPPIDWDEFERSFWAHVRRGSPRAAATPHPIGPLNLAARTGPGGPLASFGAAMALSDRIDRGPVQEPEPAARPAPSAPEKEPIDRALPVVAGVVVNILQQTGASIGTAVLSVLLASAISSQLGGGGHGTIGAAASVPPAVRAHIAPPMAAAFGQTFWWALGLLAVAFMASLALPKRKPVLAGDEQPLPIPI